MSTRRHLWYWVNFVFNRVDHSRIQTVGPDRAAAEWILRLGGSVKFRGLDHWNSSYNHLPSGILHLHAIDATGLAITSNGLEHLEGLAHLQELSLSKCKYLYNDGIALIRHVQKTILYLDLSDCAALTGHCLHHLGSLKNLRVLNVTGINASKEDFQLLHNYLPRCKILS